MGGVQQAQALGHALPQVLAIALKRHVAPHINLPEIHRGPPVPQPFRHDFADAAGGLQADGVHPRGDEAVGEAGSLAQVVANIRREALRAAEEFLQAGGFQGRHPRHGPLQNRLEMLKITGDFIEAEVLGDPLHAPGPGLRLEGPHQ